VWRRHGNPIKRYAQNGALLTYASDLSEILARHLTKSAKQMFVVRSADLEIGSAAERHGTSMAKYLPKPLRALYRGRGAQAVNRFTGSNLPVNEIEGKATKEMISATGWTLFAHLALRVN
jgi:hypothetical protein